MDNNFILTITGLDPRKIEETKRVLLESRLHNAFDKYIESEAKLLINYFDAKTDIQSTDEYDIHERSKRYLSTTPKWDFDKIILSKETIGRINKTISLIENQNIIFEIWGLKEIEPYCKSILNFYGNSGTGKTVTAHAVADKLSRDIIIVTYAELESKYMGESPKNLEAVFCAAEKNNAVLFIDEADSLLSKRICNVSQGSEQAANSLRSQLLLILERTNAFVIFSTNLIENYDHAFRGRIQHVYFPMPDDVMRARIWDRLLIKSLPTHDDIDTKVLANLFSNFSGRDIKNAIIDAATICAATNSKISQISLVHSAESIQQSNTHVNNFKYGEPNNELLTEAEKREIITNAEINSFNIVATGD